MKNLASESTISAVASLPDGIALGLGLTNGCNLSCAFCYRDPARTDRLTLQEVKAVMERLPIRSVNLGTGENGMHPDFRTILSYLRPVGQLIFAGRLARTYAVSGKSPMRSPSSDQCRYVGQ